MIFAIVCVILKFSFIDWFNCVRAHAYVWCMGIFAQACHFVCDV